MASRSRKISVMTMGTSLSWYNYYQDRMIRLLQVQTARIIRNMNIGENGEHSGNGINRIATAVACRPDFVFIEYSMNDAAFLTQAAAISNKTTIVNAFKAVMPASRIYLMTMNGPGDAARSNLLNYYADDRTLATSLGVSLMDHYPNWVTYGMGTGNVPDLIHPTQAATEAVTTPAMVSVLAPLIAAL